MLHIHHNNNNSNNSNKMKIESLNEHNMPAVNKKSNQIPKHYSKYYNGNTFVSENSQQQQQTLQRQQQQQQQQHQLLPPKNRCNYTKMKLSNNNRNKFSNNNNNNANCVDNNYLAATAAAAAAKSTKKMPYGNNTVDNNISSNVNLGNGNPTSLTTNSKNRYHKLPLQQQQQQQRQQLPHTNSLNNNSYTMKNQNILLTISADAADVENNLPIASTTSTATIVNSTENRSSTNTNNVTPQIASLKSNNNNSYENSIAYPPSTTVSKPILATTSTTTTISPESLRNTSILLAESQQQKQQHRQQLETTLALSTTAKTTLSATNDNSTTTTGTAVRKEQQLQPQQQLQKQQQQQEHKLQKFAKQQQYKPLQQLSDCDYYNSTWATTSAAKAYLTTTARTKGYPNSASSLSSSSSTSTTSSTSSSPLPTATGISNINNSSNINNQEFNSKVAGCGGGGASVSGGGGGNNNNNKTHHHNNRRRFWKSNSYCSGITAAPATTPTSSAGGSEAYVVGSGNSGIAPVSLSTNGVIAANSETSTSATKSTDESNNNKVLSLKHQRNQQSTQLQYPEVWQKSPTVAMTMAAATVTTTVTPAATVNASISTTTTKPLTCTSAVVITATTTTTATVATTTNNVETTRLPEQTKLADVIKTTVDASTTTEKLPLQTAKTQMQQQQQQQQHLPLTAKARTYTDGGDGSSVGGNTLTFPPSMPSYTLDFLHSVGKRMAENSENLPTTARAMNISPNIAPSSVATRSNRFNNAGGGGGGAASSGSSSSGNQHNYHHHHHHHHPHPKQLTIASFLQKDLLSASENASGGGGGGGSKMGTGGSNRNSNGGNNSDDVAPTHNYNNHNHRGAGSNAHQGYYTHPTHYFRQQNFYAPYGCNNAIAAAGGLPRYHATAEHAQRYQHTRSQQQQQRQHQQQYNNNNSTNTSPNSNNNNNNSNNNNKHKTAASTPQAKAHNLQNSNSSSSSTSSLASLTSTGSSHVGGNARQQPNATATSHKSVSTRSNTDMLLPPNNSSGHRHNRQQLYLHYNHHNHTGTPNAPQLLAQQQNYNHLTYVATNMPPPLPVNCGAVGASETTSSRACSPALLNTPDSATLDATAHALINGNRYLLADQHAYYLNSPHVTPAQLCTPPPPPNNINSNDANSTSEHDSSTAPPQQQQQQVRPGSIVYNSSSSSILTTLSPQIPSTTSPMEFVTFNLLIHQLQPQPIPLHLPPHAYRNGLLAPINGLPNQQQQQQQPPPQLNGFHEDEHHLQAGKQQQQQHVPYATTNESLSTANAGSGSQNGNGYQNSNGNSSVYSNTTSLSISPRSHEEDHVLEQIPTLGGQLKRSSSDISTSDCSSTLSSARSGSRSGARNQQPPLLTPAFMLFPFNEQNPLCRSYLAYLRTPPSSSANDQDSNTPPDRFMSRSQLVEVKETPPTLLNNTKWDSLSQQIWHKFVNAQQTEETYKSKMRLWQCLYVTIKRTYPRFGLYLVGSTMTGFGADTSDIDMCLVSRGYILVEQRMDALFNLHILRDCLKKTEDFESFNLIEAKVPILRFRDKMNHFEVDLNFNNPVGIKNTHLLYCYTQLDWRLRPLALIVKLWAQYHDINNAKYMTISSYSLVLMVIHFLQCGVNPPVLPCLHKMFPEKFTPLRSNEFGHVDMNDNVGPYDSQNTQTLGELFLNFLEYYSVFDYRQNAISVRTGGLLPVNVCRQARSLKNDMHQWKELCIEEPFDLTNTARSVYDFDTFQRVKAVFITSFHALKSSLDMNSVFAPLVPPQMPLSARMYMKRPPHLNSPTAAAGNSINIDEKKLNNATRNGQQTIVAASTTANILDNAEKAAATANTAADRSDASTATNL